MLQSILVYSLLTIIMVSLGAKTKKTESFKYAIIAVAIYSLIFGLRYGVGMDFFSYKRYFYSIKYQTYADNQFEPGLIFMMKLVDQMNLSSSFFFGLVAFLQLIIVVYALRENRNIYPYLLFAFMVDCVWLSFGNGLRQEIAFCIFVFSISFIKSGKLVCYLICIGIAYLFHKSSLILFPIYFLLRMDFRAPKIYMQIGLLVIALILSNLNFMRGLLMHIDGAISFVGYDNYNYNGNDEGMLKKGTVGLGFVINLMIDMIIILHSNRMKSFFQSKQLNAMYTLYFIGVLLKYALLWSLLFQRVNYYFYGFQFIISAFLLYYLHKTNKATYIILTILLALVLVGTLSKMETNTSQFIFNWQTDLFHLKNYISKQ